jgi:dienelactone hydrolase
MIRTAAIASAASIAALTAAGAAAAADVTYEVNGESFAGYYAAAENPKGLVVIVHDWDGMTDYERKRADMLAELGYAAFAVDVFGAGKLPQTQEERMAATRALYEDRERMRALLAGGLAAAREQSPVDAAVVMGYCFGGAATLELARSGLGEGVLGYASFHGGVETPEGQSWPAETPPVLILQGGIDENPSMADIATLSTELEAAGITYDIEVYSGAPHAFTVFGSERYRERADMKSWEALQGFLAENLDGAAS